MSRKVRPDKKKVRPFDKKKEVRAIARERVGAVKPSQVIKPKSERKPKYKSDPLKDVSDSLQ